MFPPKDDQAKEEITELLSCRICVIVEFKFSCKIFVQWHHRLVGSRPEQGYKTLTRPHTHTHSLSLSLARSLYIYTYSLVKSTKESALKTSSQITFHPNIKKLTCQMLITSISSIYKVTSTWWNVHFFGSASNVWQPCWWRKNVDRMQYC